MVLCYASNAHHYATENHYAQHYAYRQGPKITLIQTFKMNCQHLAAMEGAFGVEILECI